MQVLFCVLRAEVTYVVDRRVVYFGPRPSSQLEGTLTLPAAPATPLIMGTSALPWHRAAGLLEGGDSDGLSVD